MNLEKIDVGTLSYVDGTTVVGQPQVPGLSTQAMQKSIENLGRNVIVPKVNELVDAANDSYSKAETDAAIDEKVVEIGAGDMAKAVYDPDGAVELEGGIMAVIAVEKARAEAVESNIQDAVQSVTCTLTAAEWVGSAEPYTQSVAVEGMTAEWVPGAAQAVPAAETTKDALIALREALGCITMIESSEGALTFVCAEEIPTMDMTVQIPGVM